MLNVPLPSPPVPDDVDRARRARRRAATRSRIAVAKPASSSTVSPRIRRATSSAASWAGVASPSMTAPIAARASSIESVPPSTIVARAARTSSLIGSASDGDEPPRHRSSASPAVANEPVASSRRAASPSPARRRKLASRCGPCGVSTDSGWNWTPSSGSATWRMPMTTRSTSLIAVTRSSGGQRRRVDRERVVAGGHERRRHPLEQPGAVVGHLGRLAVDERRRPDDATRRTPPPSTASRGRRRGAGSRAPRRPRSVATTRRRRRVARARRDDDPAQVGRRVVGEGLDPGPVDGVVADDADVRPGRLERLDEVEGEAVVVVDDEDHAGLRLAGAARRRPRPPPRRARGVSGIPAASSIARRMAAALCSVSSNSRSGTRAGDDAGAGVDVGLAVLEDRAADGDRRVEVAVVAEVADRAAVQAASLALGRGDELHRPDLRRARQRAGREDGPQRVERVELRPEPALDVRHEVEDVAVALDLHVLADRDGARPATRPRSLRPRSTSITCSARSLGSRWSCSARSASSRASAPRGRVPGDRVGRQPVALDLEEQLRARADDLERRRAHEEQVRARVDPAQRAVEADAVERRAGRGVGRQVERLAAGEHDLDRLAGRDRVLRDLDRADVLVAPEAGLDRVAGRAPAAGRAARWRRRRASRPRSAGRSARAPRRSPPRRSGSGPRGPGASVWSEAIAHRVWVRWSKTRTRSVSMNAAVGTPTGSRSGQRHASARRSLTAS